MFGVALGVHGVETNGAFHDVVLFLDMFCAPGAQIMVDHGTWPLVTMSL